MNSSISELQLMTDKEKQERIIERLIDYYGSQSDYQQMLNWKWQMAMFMQKGGY